MNNIYILDDSQSIIDVLKIIIDTQRLGKVCGTSLAPADALDDFKYIKPDLIIVDLLMPQMDGISFIQNAKNMLRDISFVMLSQVSDKGMISKAYEAGVDFFIQKPINSIEVVNVIKNVLKKKEYEKTINQMNIILNGTAAGQNDNNSSHSARDRGNESELEKIKLILSRLGVISEPGAEDILTICKYYLENPNQLISGTVKDICSLFTSSPKSMEQRVRRTAATGLSNLAHFGLDDFSDEDYIEYSKSIYSYEQIRKEMDYIQGKSLQHGNVKIKRFISALIHEAEKM